MRESILELSENEVYGLRSIHAGDLETLRLWKNKNQSSFFHKTEISRKEQERWFDSFGKRRDDHMLMVEVSTEEGNVSVGCMGYRVKDDHVDIYNVMRGCATRLPGFSMGRALRLLVDHAIRTENLPVRCIVIKDNPAIDWYLRNGFKNKVEDPGSVTLEFIAEGKAVPN